MKRIKYPIFLLVFSILSFGSYAQKKLPGTPPTVQSGDADTTKSKAPAKKTSEPKPYAEIITAKAITANGFFKVHKVEDKYYFEIPDSLLNRDVLVVNRISKAAAGNRVSMMGYGGDQIGKNVIQFSKGPSNKLFLKSISFQEMASDTTVDGMSRSLMNSNLQPLEASFDIKAFSPNKDGLVIDVTDYINGDNDILFFDSRIKKAFSLSQLLADRSYIQEIKSFPMNVEIKTMKTYMKTSPPTPGNPMSGSSSPISYELNSSLVLLPKVPMQPRYFDPRVGYFATGYTDFDANPQGVKRIAMITRWRLEPKDEDIEKYKRGELVEPKKPIIYYIDPATPAKWVPYLIDGVNDWQKAFEKAGFKNAVMAKMAPVGDPTWSLDDARNSAIVYKPSAIANASGPNVNDPRSGEIIESHINWYHNVMELVRNWYFIQASATDPRARKMKFDDELMGQLIRFVSSHEVGHTLGLRHNYGSSSTTPVENLRNKKWLDMYGHTPSIMDYARFNYVAQPEDKIGDAGMYPHIGDYDKWAIEWGYKWMSQFSTASAETSFLNKWVVEKIGANPRLIFGTESDSDDPRNQNEDLGDNAMKASAYGIKNLKRILPNILTWTRTADEGYDNAETIYGQLVTQFGRYMGHVAKNIGGIENTPSTVEQSNPVYAFTAKATQKEAVDFLQQQLFTTPMWLIDKRIYSVTGAGNMETIYKLQSSVLGRIMSDNTIGKLLRFEAFDNKTAYTPNELFNDLKKGIWSELKTNKPIDIYRRNLQKIYANKLIELLQPSNQSGGNVTFGGITVRPGGSSGSMITDNLSIVKGQAKALSADIKAALPMTKDLNSRLHLQDVMERLNDAFRAFEARDVPNNIFTLDKLNEFDLLRQKKETIDERYNYPNTFVIGLYNNNTNTYDRIHVIDGFSPIKNYKLVNQLF